MFCTCKQHSDLIPDLQGVLFPSYLLLDFFYICIVLDGTSSNKLFQVFDFAESNNWFNWKKFFLKPYWSSRSTSDFEVFVLYWEVYIYMSLSVVALTLSVLLLVLANFLYLQVWSSEFWFQSKMSHNLFLQIAFGIL